MERSDTIDKLNDLIQLDVDAVQAYDHAIKNVEYDDIRKRFGEFQDDHRTHIRNLAEMVQQLGGTPVKLEPSLKGYLLEGLTALRSATGTKAALEAMKTNEKLTNRKYEEAVAQNFAEGVMKLLRMNFAQEQQHLAYIEEILAIPRREL